MRKHRWKFLAALLLAALALLPLLHALAWLYEQSSTKAMLDRFSRVHEGDSRTEIEALLGKPHAIRTAPGWPLFITAGDVAAEWDRGGSKYFVVFAGGQSVRYKRCELYREPRGPLDYLKEQWRMWFPDR
jgi:hypothetical protein